MPRLPTWSIPASDPIATRSSRFRRIILLRPESTAQYDCSTFVNGLRRCIFGESIGIRFAVVSHTHSRSIVVGVTEGRPRLKNGLHESMERPGDRTMKRYYGIRRIYSDDQDGLIMTVEKHLKQTNCQLGLPVGYATVILPKATAEAATVAIPIIQVAVGRF